MLTFALADATHLLAALGWLVAAQDSFSKSVLDQVAAPLLTSAQFLIPAAVAISGIHKMMEHRQRGSPAAGHRHRQSTSSTRRG
jgi:hypothetical protein